MCNVVSKVNLALINELLMAMRHLYRGRCCTLGQSHRETTHRIQNH